MTDSLIVGRQVLEAQPFSRLLGAELTEFSAERVEISIPITEQIEQQHGTVHGGVISYAADNALTFAGGSILGAAVVTSEFKINYLKPAIGARLLARANVLYAGKSQAVCRCDVFSVSANGAETLCAAAQGTIVIFKKSPKTISRQVAPDDQKYSKGPCRIQE